VLLLGTWGRSFNITWILLTPPIRHGASRTVKEVRYRLSYFKQKHRPFLRIQETPLALSLLTLVR
jgi:hypothetical protein